MLSQYIESSKLNHAVLKPIRTWNKRTYRNERENTGSMHNANTLIKKPFAAHPRCKKTIAILAIWCVAAAACLGCSKQPAPHNKNYMSEVEKIRKISADVRAYYDAGILRDGKTPPTEELREKALAWFSTMLEQPETISQRVRKDKDLDAEHRNNLLSLCITLENMVLTTREAYRRLTSFDVEIGEAQLRLAKSYFDEINNPKTLIHGKSKPAPDTSKQYTGNRPNILFILIDTVRADHMGCYGYPKDTTPYIDTLAADGVLFDTAIAHAPYTTPSVASVFSGRYPSEQLILKSNSLQKGASLIIQFQKNQYHTAGFSANPLISAKTSFDQGFEYYVTRPQATADVINNEVFRWLIGYSADSPFFMYIHYLDPHHTYYAPDIYTEMFVKSDPGYTASWIEDVLKKEIQYAPDRDSRGFIPAPQALALIADQKHVSISQQNIDSLQGYYHGEIRFVDDQVRNLIETLRARNMLENTIIVIASDHGEAFLEHGHMMHGATLYDEMLHVPLIIWDNAQRLAPARITGQVELSGILPTLMAMANIKEPAGVDARPLLLKNGGHGTPYIFSVTQSAWSFKDKKLISKLSLRTEGGKLIYTPGADIYELYDLDKDRHETINIAGASGQSIPANILNKMAPFRNNTYWESAQPHKDINPEIREDMKSLGYIQ